MLFSSYLFLICHRLLNLDLREEWQSEVIEEIAVHDFIRSIFSNGVHGKREPQQQFGNCLAYETAQGSSVKVRLRLLFPSLKNLSAYYTYAHRYPLLLPITWVHRWGRTCMRSDYTLVQKIAPFFQSPKLAKQQSSLLVALDLVDEV